MGIDVKTYPHDDFLEVVVSGTYEMHDSINKFPEVLSACRFLEISKVLIDFRELEGILAATEKVLYAFGIQEHYRKHVSIGGQKLMIAYVGKAPIVSTYEPGLKIAKGSNMPVELFTSIEEAYEWLSINPD